MAITPETRTAIIQLSVVMLGRAPGRTALLEYNREIEAGATIEQLADQIAATGLFGNIFPDTLTSTEFADSLLTKVFADEVSSEIHEFAVGLVAELLDEGASRASVIYLVTRALADIGPGHPAYEDFAGAIARFDNQVAVAEHYTLSSLNSRPSWEVIADVTSDIATRDAAIFAIDNPPPPPPPGETFDLTGTFDDLTGTAGDDTFIASDAFTWLDRIDGGEGDDSFEVTVSEGNFEIPPSVRISNVEELSVFADGAVKGDFSEWEGLERIRLRALGNEAYENGLLAIDLNAGGARVSAGFGKIDGDIFIADALTVNSLDVRGNSDINIASGEITTFVSLDGGADIKIGAEFSDVDGVRVVMGQSETVTSVKISNIGYRRADGDINSITIRSNAIERIDLSSTSGNATVINNSSEPEDLLIDVYEYGRWGTDSSPPSITLSGTGAAETVTIRPEPGSRILDFSERLILLAGSSDFILRDDAIKSVIVSGPVLEPDGDMFTYRGRTYAGGFTLTRLSIHDEDGNASTTLEYITVTDAAGIELDASDNTGLKSIDAGGSTMGENVLTVVGSEVLESVITGGGDDTLTVTGMDNLAGFTVALGAGADTFVANTGGSQSSIDGGDGFDTLKFVDGDAAGVVNSAGDSIYINFENLDISTAPGAYDLGVFGASHVTISEDIDQPVTLVNSVSNSFSINVLAADVNSITIGDDGAAEGSENLVSLNLHAYTSFQGTARTTVTEFNANTVETIVIKSEGNPFSSTEHLSLSAWYSTNTITNLNADSLDFLVIDGGTKLVIDSRLESVTVVDARLNTRGVSVKAGGDGNAVEFRGGPGYDDFFGGAGDDLMTGGSGDDYLTGGAGSDTFRYESVGDSSVLFGSPEFYSRSNFDVIMDFEVGVDSIFLSENLGVAQSDLTGSSVHLSKDTISDAERPSISELQQELRSYIGDGADFFSDGAADFLIATTNYGNDLFVFIDLNRNGDLEYESDFAILLEGISQSQFTADIFEVG